MEALLYENMAQTAYPPLVYLIIDNLAAMEQ